MPNQGSRFLELEEPVIALVDTMEFRRAGFLRLLHDWAETSNALLPAYESVASLLEANEGSRCKMVILSIGGMDVIHGDVLAQIEQLRNDLPQASLVILSDHTEPKQIVSAFRLGAKGFISTGTDPSVALRALSFILCGGSFFPPHALAELSQLSDAASRTGSHESHNIRISFSVSGSMTSRQREVLSCLRLGKSNKQIARELGMQEATVKVHIRQIMRKLGVANRTQAALQAAQLPEAVPSEPTVSAEPEIVLPIEPIARVSLRSESATGASLNSALTYMPST